MSGENPLPAADEAIQLHFCQTCGVSIPQADVDLQRAHAAPGGFVCATCSTGDEAAAPAIPRVATQPAVATPGARGSQALVVVFLLYVVGVTSFLLYKDLTFKAPKLNLPEMAAPRDIERLDAKLDTSVERTRVHLNELQMALQTQHDNLKRLTEDYAAMSRENAALHLKAGERDAQLLKEVLELTNRTIGLTNAVETVFEKKMEAWRNDLEASIKNTGKDSGTKNKPTQDAGKDEPKTSPEDEERARKVRASVETLLNRSTPENKRFTAAVELGDLKDPSAVDPLIRALEADPNGLVRRGAAWSLGKLGKHSLKAFPALIKQVGGRDEYVAYTCDKALEDICQDATGSRVSFNFDPTMKSKQRKGVAKQWSKWLKEHKDQLLPRQD